MNEDNERKALTSVSAGSLGHCEQCGTEAAGLLAGQCPSCLLGLGLELPTGSGEPAGNARIDSGSGAPEFTMIARYRILRRIGEGGMGVVYEAEQEQPCRTVALKVVKSGLATPELLRRFQDEAQALGRLQHPGIAQIYEAGTADTGLGPQPYFAMELIHGCSLTEYADTHRLNVRERLELVAKVAEAAHHAHQRGLIHRDLKPANILVDGTGQPRIVDFGVARAINSDVQATLQTDLGRLVGTLAYMSPEQAQADPLEIDIRTDVYALGVILYELLAGRPPYAMRKRIDETIKAIREEDPARLSSANRLYRGDIETITAKALEKDKVHRYGTAAELAADIRHFLRHEPIVARPPSARYQLQKFTRRHRSLVAGMAAVFLVLVLGIAVSTTLWMQAVNAEADARQREWDIHTLNEQLQAVNKQLDDERKQPAPALTPTQPLEVRPALHVEVGTPPPPVSLPPTVPVPTPTPIPASPPPVAPAPIAPPAAKGSKVLGHVVREGPALSDQTQVRFVGLGRTLYARIEADGSFEFPSVNTGTYQAVVGPRVTMQPVSVTVGDTDVGGLQLFVPKCTCGTVTGRIILDGAPANARMPLFSMSFVGPVKAAPVVTANGTFQTHLQSGEYVVSPSALPPGYFMKSIVSGSKSLAGSKLTLTGADPVEIIVTLGIEGLGI